MTLASALPVGSYRLFVCGSTSILDLLLNPLGDGADRTSDFTVIAISSATLGERGVRVFGILFCPPESSINVTKV